jgi:hypothetical protein
MAKKKGESDFDIGIRTSDALLDVLREQGLCPCCVARALMLQGALLFEMNFGREAAITWCKQIIDGLNTSPGVSTLDCATRH